MESSPSSKVDKPLSIDKAAFLLLRVRRVFKKKIALKKEKNVGPDVVFGKGDSIHLSSRSGKKRGIPPLIRSRTVPAIIVPFSILQAQLVKAGGGCAGQSGNISPCSGPGTSASASSAPSHPHSKSDFSTPGVDYVQFLTGSGSPSSSIAGTPPSRREPHFLGLSNPSIYRDSPNDSSWNLNTAFGGPLSTCSTSNVSPISVSGDSCNGNIGHMGFGAPFPHPSPTPYSGGSGKGFSRFARLLNSQLPKNQPTNNAAAWNQFGNQGTTTTGPTSTASPSATSSGIDVAFALATPSIPRRRRSLENEDISSCRPRAVSIDSLVRSHFLAPPGEPGSGRSPSPKRYSTSSAGPTCGHRPDNRFQEGFVAAVESGNLARVKTFLETSDVDLNGVTVDGLTVLDLAVILRNRPMVKLLLSHGATDNQYWRKESMSEQLNTIVLEAEKKSEDLMAKILKCSTFGNLSPAQLKDLEKEFHVWEKRYKRFRKMRTEYTQIRPPDPPTKVTLDVIGPTSVKIRFQENESPENSISTKYKIEWSGSEEFRSGPTTRVMEIFDLRRMETILNDLKASRRVFFRVSCGNCAGYGEYLKATPASVVPSSWRDFESRRSRYAGKSIIFDVIFKQIRDARPEYASEIRSIDFKTELTTLEGSSSSSVGLHGPYIPTSSSSQQKKNQKIISIKQLFSAAPKFQKNFKRGVFLSCVMYSEDKLLLTTEEFLPTIEIDETFSSTLHNDFHWLLKVACTWEDVKCLKQDMEKSGSASTFHFRLKLLQAAASMQVRELGCDLDDLENRLKNALGIGDLGRLYYKTIRDKSNSVVIISTINYVRSTKLISSLNVRWTPITKMSTRKATDDISDVLINSIQEQILYHQVSNIPLGKGLYMGYLKLASSVDGPLKIVVPEKTPNILPHAKIRDNPHVSSEEWLLIQRMVKSKSTESLSIMETNNNMKDDEMEEEEEQDPDQLGLTFTDPVSSTEMSEAQDLFRSQLNAAMRKLFAFLEIDYNTSLTHRLYNAEVIEVNGSVSIIVVFPALENVCLLAGQSDKLLTRNDLIPLPVQVFEMIHLSTYQKEFITRYARLSTILEVDTVLAQHNQRVAFSADEVSLAKHRLQQLQDFQSQLDANWKGSRWIIDLVTTSRDKNCVSASVKTLSTSEGLQTSSESIVSADSVPQKIEGSCLLGFHSKSDQSLRFGGNLGGTGIKFSRSENQLATIGTTGSICTGNGGSESNSETARDSFNLSIHPTHPAGGRKVSVPIQCLGPMLGGPGSEAAVKLTEKLTFNPKIYSNHSQSDTTISNSVVSQDSVSSASLHNLYRHSSSSQITPPIPSVIVSSGSPVASPIKKTFPRTSPIPPHVHVSLKGPRPKCPPDPPPVPPRRTLPPPPPPCESDPPELSTPPPPKSWSGSGGSIQETEITSPLVPLTGIIQVYAAYESGLSPGTSVRLQVTNQTTSEQVVDLVVKQLNSEVISKGNSFPIYEQSSNFVLVSVIGARERCLRGDFRPLHLQSPWKSGRLFVRIKNDVTAAIALNNRRDLTYP